MYIEVTKSRFRDEFRRMNRADQFSYEALGVLFDALIELEGDSGDALELDVIALCCDWTEMSDVEIQEQYDMSVEELQDTTIVLKVNEYHYLVHNF